MSYIPEAGDIILINFDPAAGHEIQKKRPALVVSPQKMNRMFQQCWVLPITNQVKGNAFEIPVAAQEVTGVAKVHQIRSVSWEAREARFIEKAAAKTLQAASHAIAVIVKN